MFLKEYLVKSQLGLWNSGISRKPGNFDVQFHLQRFECKSNDIYSVEGSDGNTPPFCVQFCKERGQEHIYSLACEDGEIIFMNSRLPAKKAKVQSWNGHRNAIFDMCWLSQESKLLTASGDQTVLLWDATTRDKISCFRGHNSSVKSISLKPDNESVFLTGARDGNILLWDTRTKADPDHVPVISISNVHDGAPPLKHRKRSRKGQVLFGEKISNSISCVLFQDEYTFLSTGASDWSIKGWDLRRLEQNGTSTPTPLFDIKNAVENHKNQGYTSLVMHPDGNSFFVNCTDGTITRYKLNRTMPSFMSSFYGHKVGTYFVKIAISDNGQYIISGSSNDKAYIWKVSKPGVPLVTLQGHDAEVTAVAWDPNDWTKCITCGDDEKVFHWSLGNTDAEKDVENPVVGHAEVLSPEDVRAPSHGHLNTPLAYTTPTSSSKHGQVSSSSSSVATPRLTQWFTPKAKLAECLQCECTPKLGTLTEMTTPIKSRPVFSELGNSEDRKVMPGISAIRRAINFGSKSESKAAAHNPPKKIKLSSKQNTYSIKKFFQASPRTNV